MICRASLSAFIKWIGRARAPCPKSSPARQVAQGWVWQSRGISSNYVEDASGPKASRARAAFSASPSLTPRPTRSAMEKNLQLGRGQEQPHVAFLFFAVHHL